MNLAIGDHWQALIDRLVFEGRYGSASEVVHEGLRLVEERESRLKALRATSDSAFTESDAATDEELESVAFRLRARGVAP